MCFAASFVLSSCRGNRWSAGQTGASEPILQHPWHAAGPPALSHAIAGALQRPACIDAMRPQIAAGDNSQYVLHRAEVLISSIQNCDFTDSEQTTEWFIGMEHVDRCQSILTGIKALFFT